MIRNVLTVLLLGLVLPVLAEEKAGFVATYPVRDKLPPLDAKIAAGLAAVKVTPVWQQTPAEARAGFEKRSQTTPKLNDPVAKVENRMISGPAGQVPVRVYTPKGTGPFPIVVFIHGGGWVVGSLETVDDLCRSICSRAGAAVVSVDYRLAPEHKFPAPVEDCFAVLQWCAKNGAEIQGDGKRLAVAGDSAGGNLSAAVSLYSRDKGGPKVALQVLIYPVTNHNFDTVSYHQFGDGYGLTREAMIYYWKSYLAKPEDAHSPYASPLQAKDLKGVAPALVITAQYDVLRDDGEAYAARLQQAGVPVQATRYLTLNHGFIRAGAVNEDAKRGVQEIAEGLKKTFENAK